ncbi:MAG: carbohydrate-binding protein, partial [Planctomycetales bacterium]|nr:carbohydrate-binding protein [Planctomycetales bacterium]
FKTVTCNLKNQTGQSDLCLVFRGSGAGELLRLDSFHFKQSDEPAAEDWKISAYGVGQYEGTWDKIQAEWHTAAGDGASKHEIPGGGFEVRFEKDGSWILFPKVNSMLTDTFMSFSVASANRTGAIIEIHKGTADGELLGSCRVPNTGGSEIFKTVKCKLRNRPGQNDLCLVVKGIGGGELLRLDWVSFR